MIITEFMHKIGNMKFFGFDELYSKKEEVKDSFKNLRDDEKYIYKWFFFYQTCHLNNRLKENMWDYITGVISKEKIEKEYKIYCKKKEKAAQKARDKQKSRQMLGIIWQKTKINSII